MNLKWIEAIAEWMAKSEVIESSDIPLYSYAIESLLLSLSTVSLAILIGAICGNVIQGITLLVPFMFLRKFCGGYHARKLKTCIVSSSLLLFLFIRLSMVVHCGIGLAAVTGLSMLVTVVFSPVENANRILEEEEKRIYHRVVICLELAFLIQIGLFYWLKLESLTVGMCMGIQLTAVLQLPCVLYKIWSGTYKKLGTKLTKNEAKMSFRAKGID